MATSREEILEQVKGALSEKLGIDESEITEEASFEEDLGADSLDRRQGDRLRHRAPGLSWTRPGRTPTYADRTSSVG